MTKKTIVKKSPDPKKLYVHRSYPEYDLRFKTQGSAKPVLAPGTIVTITAGELDKIYDRAYKSGQRSRQRYGAKKGWQQVTDQAVSESRQPEKEEFYVGSPLQRLKAMNALKLATDIIPPGRVSQEAVDKYLNECFPAQAAPEKDEVKAAGEVDITRQNHYIKWAMQPVEFIAMNNLDYLTGNVIKYVMRWRDKNGIEDIKKAQHYLSMILQQAEGKVVKP